MLFQLSVHIHVYIIDPQVLFQLSVHIHVYIIDPQVLFQLSVHIHVYIIDPQVLFQLLVHIYMYDFRNVIVMQTKKCVTMIIQLYLIYNSLRRFSFQFTNYTCLTLEMNVYTQRNVHTVVAYIHQPLANWVFQCVPILSVDGLYMTSFHTMLAIVTSK